MKEIQIKGSLRTETGKKFSKQLRREGALPAIIYGGKENVLMSLNERDIKDLIYTPDVHIVNIDLGKKKYKAIIKELQFHPVTDKVLHIDFLEVFEDKKLTLALPVKLVGSSEGVKQGGKLSLIARKIRVCGYPKDLPEVLRVDVTDLGLGKSRQVQDFSFENFEIVEPKSTVVANVKLTRAARGAQGDEEEGAEEAAAAPAEEATEE
ncbi:MAG: 50S ribosomal protein L25/general stress protein Ctc [Bacteroidales bacterium]